MTVRNAVLIAFLAGLLTPIAHAQVNALPSLPHLLVKGESSREVVPDRFTVSVMLTAVDAKPETARETVQRNLAALVRTAQTSGAIADSIDATTFSAGPEYEYQEQKRVFKGTRATRQLQMTFASADSTRKFLAGLQTSEDVTLGGIQPGYSGESALRADLKAEAMTQTRMTAELLAKSYGTRLRGLYSVSDVAPNFAYGIQAGQWPQPRRGSRGYPPPPPAPPAPQADMSSIQVTGTRITPESLEVGTMTVSEHLYAIFLLAD